MKKEKVEKLEKGGWKISDTQEFLNLTDEEMRLIDLQEKQPKELADLMYDNIDKLLI